MCEEGCPLLSKRSLPGKKTLAERVHKCNECGYETDRDVAAAQVVMQRGCLAVGHTVAKLAEGKVTRLPLRQESPGFNNPSAVKIV